MAQITGETGKVTGNTPMAGVNAKKPKMSLVDLRKSVIADMAEIRHIADGIQMNLSIESVLIDLTNKIDYLVYQADRVDDKVANKFLIMASQLNDDVYKIGLFVQNKDIQEISDAVDHIFTDYIWG